MEALKLLFKRKAEFVRSEESQGNEPTDSQLASFLQSLTAETGYALRGAPSADRQNSFSLDATFSEADNLSSLREFPKWSVVEEVCAAFLSHCSAHDQNCYLASLLWRHDESWPRARKQVREAIRGKFDEAGWDTQSNSPTRDEPPTLEELYAFLDSTIDVLESFDLPIEPTPEEVEDETLACQRLWELDTNRLTPEVEYAIDLQSGKKPYQEGDCADNPLFTYVKEEVFSRPTFAAFVELLDNYTAAVGTGEVVTGEERRETRDFLDAVMATPCMRYAHQYLVARGAAPADEGDFKGILHNIWFAMYSRVRGTNDSSGFEHVFVGESKKGSVTGLHNWIQIYTEEKKGNLDYKGYIFPRQRGYDDSPAETEQLITVQFEWNGDLKNVSSSFIGVSPEFELALYTMLFLLDKEKTETDLGPYSTTITTYIYRDNGERFIGSAFPAGS